MFRSGTVESWLTGESLSELERLERLAGDAELFAALEQQGFAGPDWDYFADVLARYGLAVIRGWMRRGLIEATDLVKDKFGESAVRFGRELRGEGNTTGSASKNPADYK